MNDRPIKSVKINELFEAHSEDLALTWVAGREGGERVTCRLADDDEPAERGGSGARSECKTLIGHLSLIHPNQVQVMGATELGYFGELQKKSYEDSIDRLFDQRPACIIVAEGQELPQDFLDRANRTGTPVLATPYEGDRIVEDLGYYLSRQLAGLVTLHGVFMEVMGTGVLLVGESGIGKSELALELISRGHRLIADDAPEFSRATPDEILGTCPPALENFMEVRGLGILNIRAMFGDNAIKRSKYLRLIINLQAMTDDEILALDRIEGETTYRRLLGVDILEITLPVAPGRNLAVLIECAARNSILQAKGYSASEHFMDLQRQMIEGRRD